MSSCSSCKNRGCPPDQPPCCEGLDSYECPYWEKEVADDSDPGGDS